MVALMSNVIGRSLEQWRAAVPAGERALVVDTQHAISEITLRVVAVAAFGPTFLDSEEVQRVVKNAFVFVLNELQRRGTLGLSVVPVLKDLPTPGLRRLREGCAQIEALVRKVVRERREGRNLAINGHDLLDILLDAREESDPQRAMSERQIVDEAITFVFAAFETTSNHFQWLLAVLLAPENAAHLRRCREEVAAVLGARAPTYEDLKRLEFCDAVVHEALRLWPPAPFISKYAVEDHYIGPAERPIFVPKGTNISINAFVVNRRPEFWPEPDAFRPERWLGRDEARQHPFCFLSFSGGKRQCLGKNFALLQSKTLLAMLLQQFELEMLPGQRVAAGLEKINMVPKYPLLVRAAPRAAL
jgi:cytochrome P450